MPVKIYQQSGAKKKKDDENEAHASLSGNVWLNIPNPVKRFCVFEVNNVFYCQ